jgi:Glycosyl hydrolases family 35
MNNEKTLMAGEPARFAYHFSDEAPSLWSENLAQAYRRGVTVVETRIAWGAHERTRGVRDFSKAPRLRLERFLNLVHETGLALDVTLGFFPSAETFPEWCWELSDKTLLAQTIWEECPSGQSLTSIPSLNDATLKAAYTQFIDEAASLLSLYRYPEGPVRTVKFDLELYENTLSFCDTPDFALSLTQRYETIDQLNVVYGTTFRNFDSLRSKQAIRVLNDKRPWLAAYDYKWGRAEWLARIRREWMARESMIAFETRPILNPLPESRSAWDGPWALAMDQTLVEEHKGTPSLFAPSGLVIGSAVASLRLAEYLRARAQDQAVGFFWLGEKISLPQVPWLVVVSSKYLPRATFLRLKERVEAGGKIFFPFGLPQYDEGLNSFDWSPSSARKLVKTKEQLFFRVKETQGEVWWPSVPPQANDALWEGLEQTLPLLKREESTP